MRSSSSSPSQRSARGRTPMTNGVRKRSGTGSSCSGHFWQNASLQPSRKVRMSSLKAVSSVPSTYQRTARARKRSSPRSLRGRSAPTLCAGSTVANRSLSHPRPNLRNFRPNARKIERSDFPVSIALRRCRRAFSIWCVHNCCRKNKVHALVYVSRYSSPGLRAGCIRRGASGSPALSPLPVMRFVPREI